MPFALLRYHGFTLGSSQYEELARIAESTSRLPDAEGWRFLTVPEMDALFAKAKDVQTPTLIGVGGRAAIFSYMDFKGRADLQVTVAISKDKAELQRLEDELMKVYSEEHRWRLYMLRRGEYFYSYLTMPAK